MSTTGAGPTAGPPIVLYHYDYSPFARRVIWYLELRGIPYVQCMQPIVMPRPDLSQRLGVMYRRIPILSIGRDVYLDSRLIIRKLEQLFPERPRLGSKEGTEGMALERLFEILTIDGGLFSAAAELLPRHFPLLQNRRFIEDRADYRFGTAARLKPAEQAALRPEALADVAAALTLLETTFLADGRNWILNTDQPGLADIEAIWPLQWLEGLPGALDSPQVSLKTFPRVHSWILRFNNTLRALASTRARAPVVSGEQAEKIIRAAAFNEPDPKIDQTDPLAKHHGFQVGSMVGLWPTDTGMMHKDIGRLVGLTGDEIVIEPSKKSNPAGHTVRLHAPRHGFRVRPVSDSTSFL